MIDNIKVLAEWSAAIIELLGIGVIILAALAAIYSAISNSFSKGASSKIVTDMRHRLGQGILVGLEFLVGADIIHTVAVDFNTRTVGVLAIVILIRTFLSFTMELELTGKWPWAKNDRNDR